MTADMLKGAMAGRLEPIAEATHEALMEAINERRRIRARYHGKERHAEPQCYGADAKGQRKVRLHELPAGSSPAEKIFNVAELEHLEVLDEHFDKPGPHYKMNDSAMAIIFAQLDPANLPAAGDLAPDGKKRS